jgi:hypothetical protein
MSAPPAPYGIAFNPLASSFRVPTAGVYKITFYVNGIEANQFVVQVNGAAPSSGALVFGADGRLPSLGGAILALGSGAEITIANATTGRVDATVNLDASIGGSAAAINAWIMIEQLNG